MNLTSTTLITGAGAATGSLIASNVGDETKRVKRRNSFIGTSLALTATYAIGEFTSCRNNAEYKRQRAEIAEQTSQEYVDSRTNEELEIALRQLEEQERSASAYEQEAPKTYRK